ncbi:hypothetical protein EJB05_18167, partial [Eragrostis curvula]
LLVIASISTSFLPLPGALDFLDLEVGVLVFLRLLLSGDGSVRERHPGSRAQACAAGRRKEEVEAGAEDFPHDNIQINLRYLFLPDTRGLFDLG